MRIALFVTCLADTLFPQVGPGHGRPARAARPPGRVPARADLLRADAREHRIPAGGAAAGPALRRRVRAATRRSSRRPGRAPARSAISTRWWPASYGDEALAGRAEAVAARTYRAVRAAGRRARGRGRRRALPAPGDLPPDLPFAADAAGRRQAVAAAAATCAGIDLVELPDAESCCGFGGTFAVKNADVSTAMLADKMRNVLAPAPRSARPATAPA